MDYLTFAKKTCVYVLLYIATGFLIYSVLYWAPHEHNDFPVLRNFIIFFATVLLSKYFFYMTLSPWYDVVMKWKHLRFLKYRARNRLRDYKPLVSVIVPAWNEEVGLVTTIKTILMSEYRHV